MCNLTWLEALVMCCVKTERFQHSTWLHDYIVAAGKFRVSNLNCIQKFIFLDSFTPSKT